MEFSHRKIDFSRDMPYILECHCKINYECDTPWKRKMSYNDYRSEWFSLQNQIEEFSSYLMESAKDKRTIAEIIETADGAPVAYLWVPFCHDPESGFCFADVQDIYIEEPYRHRGVAASLLTYAEDMARFNGAKVIRSGTGCENLPSLKLHDKLGFYRYRVEFEKLL